MRVSRRQHAVRLTSGPNPPPVIVHSMIGCDHPFVDGNGRTARPLFYWSVLRQKCGLMEFISIERLQGKKGSS